MFGIRSQKSPYLVWEVPLDSFLAGARRESTPACWGKNSIDFGEVLSETFWACETAVAGIRLMVVGARIIPGIEKKIID